MTLKKKLTKYSLMHTHRELAKGSKQDMRIARQILCFLNTGSIALGLSDEDRLLETILDKAGVKMSYHPQGYTAYAYVRWN